MKILVIRFITIIILSFLLTACASLQHGEQKQVVHVVLLWLKEPGNQTHIQEIISETQKFKQISELKQLSVGKSIPSQRKIVDDSFDVGLYMTFSNIEDMQTYLDHPKHKDVVNEVLKPLVKKIVVYDFGSAEQ